MSEALQKPGCCEWGTPICYSDSPLFTEAKEPGKALTALESQRCHPSINTLAYLKGKSALNVVLLIKAYH